jgi:Flp pilus assembly protein TadD
MAIKHDWRRTFAVGLGLFTGVFCAWAYGHSLALAQTEHAAPGAGGFSDPFDTPSATQPAAPATSGSEPAAPLNTSPSAPLGQPPAPAPGFSTQTPAAPGGLPENPFGDAAPGPGNEGTAPQMPHDTMPAPSQDGTGPSAPPADFTAAQQEIKAGTDLIAEGKYEEAMQHFEEAARVDPHEAQAYFYQGVVDRMLNRYDDAIDAFTQSITLTNQENKLDPEAYLRRGVVWFYKGEYGIAYQDFDEAASILYDDPRPELWKGLSRAKQQNWLEAINSYAVALQHDDKFAPAWVNLGLGYLALNQPNKAVYCLDQAVRMEPQNAGSYFKRGIALSRMGKFREAADSYSQAIRLKPDYAEAYYNRSMVNRDLGNSQQAAKDHAEALKINPEIGKQLTSTG